MANFYQALTRLRALSSALVPSSQQLQGLGAVVCNVQLRRPRLRENNLSKAHSPSAAERVTFTAGPGLGRNLRSAPRSLLLP